MPNALSTAPRVSRSSETTSGNDHSGRLATIAAIALVAHISLALAMKASTTIGTAHAIATVLGGLAYTLTTKTIRNTVVVIAYIAGCEVLWRMTTPNLFWELGEYSEAAIMIVALARMGPLKNRTLPLLYLGLLLPSVALTFASLDTAIARQQVSFYMAGPVAIALAVIFFSNIRVDQVRLRATILAFVAPAVGIGAISFVSTRTATDLEFANGSNLAASGGFGPNQVAAILGLAVMLLLLFSFEHKLSWRMRISITVIAIALAAQSALTFARGGIGLAIAGALAASFILVRGRRRTTVVAVAFIALILGKYVVEPRLEKMTHGKLAERYSNTNSTGRDVFASTELAMFRDNPVLGVGPGIGVYIRNEQGLGAISSHTEYTRMLAEHGVLGLFAMFCLIALAAFALRRSRSPTDRAYAAAFVTWVALFLLIYGTRLVAPAFVFGLAFGIHTGQSPRRGLRELRA